MPCTTTSHYATHYSPECSVGGSGQCDGYCSAHEWRECTCPCHTDWDLPQTVAEVRDWHDDFQSVVASIDGEDLEVWEDAAALARTLYRVGSQQGRYDEYGVKAGQGRIVVVMNP